MKPGKILKATSRFSNIMSAKLCDGWTKSVECQRKLLDKIGSQNGETTQRTGRSSYSQVRIDRDKYSCKVIRTK
jgi:hypothetical protein